MTIPSQDPDAPRPEAENEPSPAQEPAHNVENFPPMLETPTPASDQPTKPEMDAGPLKKESAPAGKPAAAKTASEKPAGSKSTSRPAAVVEKPAPPKRVSQAPGINLFLVEILLPVIISAIGMWFAFRALNIWELEPALAPLIFSIAVVAVSFFLSMALDALFDSLRKRNRKNGVRFGSSPVTRLIKLAVGGLLLPVALVLAASLVTVPGGGNVLTTLLNITRPAVRIAPPDEVGSLAMRTKSSSNRVLSIQVLEGFRSNEALSQLIRLTNEDSGVLNDPAAADALSKAIASYGTAARGPLLATFKSIDPAKTTGSSNTLSGDVYDRYFTATFESLRQEITHSEPDSASRAARLAQVQAAEAQLKAALSIAPTQAPAKTASASDPRLDFILRTFLQMNISTDADLLGFAKTTAADERYSSVVRGDALLLVGKLGEKGELDFIYPYLQTTDELVQARALQAIAAIQARLAGASSSPQFPSQ